MTAACACSSHASPSCAPNLCGPAQRHPSKHLDRAITNRQEKASADFRGKIFARQFPGGFAEDFLVGFLGPLLWKKTGRKRPPNNPQQNSNQNLGASRSRSTLQSISGSGLDRSLAISHQTSKSQALLPKGPFRTKSTTVPESVLFATTVVFPHL